MSHNVWSGTDYKKNTGDLSPSNVQISSTTEWAINGERSIKSEGQVERYSQVLLHYSSTSINTNETVTGKLTILNNTGKMVQLRLNQKDNINQYNDVNIPSNVNPQEVIISRTFTDTSKVEFLLIIRNQVTVYVDNISLTML